MKKKIFYLLSIIIASISFTSSVNAAEFVVSKVVENTNVVKGNTATIKINIKSDETIKECLFKFEGDENVEYVDVHSANGWQVNESGVSGVSITNGSWTSDAPTDGQNIAEVSFRVNGDGKATIKTVQCVSTVNENSYKYDDIVVDFTAKEIDMSLKSITVTGGVMNPSTITTHEIQYFIILDSPTFGLKIETNDSSFQDKIVVKDVNGKVISDPSKITYSSNQDLMPLTITVNDTLVYSLAVIYENKEFDNSLKKITINGNELTLEPGKYSYTYEIDSSVKEVTIGAEVSDEVNFKLGSNSNISKPFDISSVNEVYATIVVEPKDSSSGATAQTYYVDVVKKGATTSPTTPPVDSGESGSQNSSGGSGSSNGNVSTNPGTGDVPMYLMAFVLIISLLGSVYMYQKNLQSFK